MQCTAGLSRKITGDKLSHKDRRTKMSRLDTIFTCKSMHGNIYLLAALACSDVGERLRGRCDDDEERPTSPSK